MLSNKTANVKTRTLLVLAIIVNAILIFAGYYYHDTHVLAVSAKKFAESGITPYEWCESFLCNPEYRWYAYPPLPFLIVAPFYKLPLNPLTERLIVKIPALLGMILLTHALMKMGWSIRKALIFIWLNPYFLYTSTLRGNFDTLCVGLMLESYILIKQNQPIAAGVLGAFSVLTKQYTAFVILLILLTQRPWRKTLKYLTSATLVGIAVVAPFFTRAPKGFLNSVLLFHLHRNPSNYGIFGLKLLLDAFYNIWNSLSRDIMTQTAQTQQSGIIIFVNSLLTLLLLVSFLKISADALKRRVKAEQVLQGGTVAFLSLSKVVNIQYFTLLVSLDMKFVEWSLLALSGMIVSLDFTKTIIPPNVSPSVFWLPHTYYSTSGTLLDGITKVFSFILYIPILKTLIQNLKLIFQTGIIKVQEKP